MGSTQCFRANVAYSLYGVKKGSSTSNACSSANYIDSFFTTGGIESFGDYTGINYDYYGASAVCELNGNGQGNQENGEPEEEQEYAMSNGQLYFSDYTSKATACSSDGNFITAHFKGAYCNGNHFQYSYGEIEGLNEELTEFSCFKIYDASGYYGSDDDAEEDEDEEGEEEGQSGDEKEQNEFDYDGAAASLLYYSSSCSHQEYPLTCPDPHGVKQSRDSALLNYAQSHNRAVPLVIPIISTILLLASATLYCLANGIRDSARRRALERKRGEPVLDMTIYEHFSQSFDRTATNLTDRVRTYTERLAAYAEELEEDEVAPIVGDDSMVGSYVAPAAATHEDEMYADTFTSAKSENSVKSTKESTNLADADPDDASAATATIANAMLSEKGVVSKPKGQGKKFKRPRLAKISKWLRSKFSRKNKK